jgi:DNA repair exonuclease SbcCD ATPase subunit
MTTEIKITKTNKYNGNIETIYHIADIHYSNTVERYPEYDLILKKLYKNLEEDKTKKIICILGDTFHNKCDTKADCTTKVTDLLLKLRTYCPVIIIEGNHDLNIHNSERSTELDRIFHERETQNIHILKENKEYEIDGIDNVVFVNTNIFAKETTKIVNKDNKKYYIGLYHGAITQSLLQNNAEIIKENCNFKTSDFPNYDLLLLGDIHKHQYLNKEKTIAYSGSLIQQNFGEPIDTHGYILWDLKKNKSKHVHINNDYVFINHTVNDITNYEIPNCDEKKHTRLKLSFHSKDNSKSNEYEQKIREKYNIKSVQMKTIEEEITSKNKECKSVQNKKYIDVYKEYLKENDMDENKDVTKKILEFIDNIENDEHEKNNKNINLISLSFSNLFTFGKNNIIDLKKMSNNNVHLIYGLNGVGKSCLVDTLLFSIYGKYSRGSGGNALNADKNIGESEIIFELNNNYYKINRKIFRSTKAPTLNIFVKNKDEEYVNMNEDSKDKNEKLIVELVGKYDDLTSSSIVLFNNESFTNKKNKDRLDMLSNIFGLEKFQKIKQECVSNKNRYSTIKIPQIKRQLVSFNEDYNDLIKKNAIENKTNNEEKILIKNKLNEILKKEGLFENKINNKEYENMEKYEKEQNDLKEKLLNIKIKKEELKINDGYDYEKEIDILNDENKHITKQQHKSQKKIKNIEQINLSTDTYDKSIEEYKNEINELNEINKIFYEKQKILCDKYNLDNIIKINDLNNLLEKENTFLNEIKTEVNERENNIKLLNTYKIQQKKQDEDYNLCFDKKCKSCKQNKKIIEQNNFKKEIEELEIKINEKNIFTNSKLIEQQTKNNELDELCKMINSFDLNTNKLEILQDKCKIQNIKIIEYNQQLKKYNENEKIFEKNKKYENKISEYEKQYANNENKINNYNELNKSYKNIIITENELLILKEINNKNIEQYNELLIIKNKYTLLISEKNEIEKKYEIIEIKIENNVYNGKKYESQKQEKILLEKNLKDSEHNLKIFGLIQNLYATGFNEFYIKNSLELLKNKMNNVISTITSDFKIEFQVLAKGIELLHKNYNKQNSIISTQLSGSQTFITNLAFRLAMNHLNLTKSSFIIVDEGFSSCDEEKLLNIGNLFDEIKKEYSLCMIVSHVKTIQNFADKRIEIKNNKNGESSIKT